MAPEYFLPSKCRDGFVDGTSLMTTRGGGGGVLACSEGSKVGY